MNTSGWALSAAMLAAILPLSAQAESERASQGPDVVSFDWGATDTLEALGLASHIVGLPHQAAPDYISHLLEGRADVGGLKTPDIAAIEALSPGVILVTGRQGEVMEELQAIADTQDVSVAEGAYFDALSDKVNGLAERFDAESQAEEQLAALQADIEAARERLADGTTAAVVTHNEGHYSLRNEPVVSELLQVERPPVPDSVEPMQRGSRTFYPVTPEALAEMSPDVVFVVDRSAAIGETPLKEDALTQALEAAGGQSIEVAVLSPALWYLSGDGLQSVKAQMTEITDVLATP